jgi:hypothetical protein
MGFFSHAVIAEDHHRKSHTFDKEETSLSDEEDWKQNRKKSDSKQEIKNSSHKVPIYQPATTTGRLFASNCFQCHGTNGLGGFERITGGEASEVYDYLGKKLSSHIMVIHGQGYSQQQLEAIIGYLNQVSK